MKNPIHHVHSVIRAGIAILLIAVLGLLAYAALYSGKTIHELLGENKVLKKAITNLTEENVVGYAKVLTREERDNRIYNTILFVMTEKDDQTKRLIEKKFEIEGDIIFFDALIIRFGKDAVMDGKEKSLFLWRRIYGEKMKPEDGFPIEAEGIEPKRYKEICSRLSVKNRDLFWSEIWNLSNEPDKLKESGVSAIYGNAIYKKVRPGLIYRFKIDATGSFYPDTIPDL
jgi:hypothetical protein